MENLDFINSKAILARLFAKENIHVIHSAHVHTAQFNTLTRTVTLPVFKDINSDVYDTFVVHEVGHALDTPSYITDDVGGWIDQFKQHQKIDPRFMDYLNVVEDARIEKRQLRRLPGMQSIFHFARNKMRKDNFFGFVSFHVKVKDRELIDRINIHFKMGIFNAAQVDFTPKEQAIVDLIAKAESWGQAVAATETLYTFVKSSAIKVKSANTLGLQSADDFFKALGDMFEDGFELPLDVNEPDAKDEPAADAAPEKQENETTNTPEDGDDQDFNVKFDEDEPVVAADAEKVESEAENGKSEKNEGNDDEKQPEAGAESAPPVLTEEFLAGKMKDYVVTDPSQATLYKTIGKTDLSALVIPATLLIKDQLEFDVQTSAKNSPLREANINARYREFIKDNKNFIDSLVNEFNRRKAASEHARTTIASTGDIDLNKLSQYRFVDDIFRKVGIIGEAKSHGVVLVIDGSGSMHNNAEAAVTQGFVIAEFCRRVSIPYSINVFDCFSIRKHNSYQLTPADEKPEIVIDETRHQCLVDSTMTTNEYKQLLSLFMSWKSDEYGVSRSVSSTVSHALFPSGGSTPLVDSLLIARQQALDLKAKYRLEKVEVLYVTDGDAGGGQCIGREAGFGKTIIVLDTLNGKRVETQKGSTNDYMKLVVENMNNHGIQVTNFFVGAVKDLRARARRFNQTYTTTRDFVKITGTPFNSEYLVNKNNLFLMQSNFGRHVNTTVRPHGNIASGAPTETEQKAIRKEFVSYLRVLSIPRKIATDLMRTVIA